MCCAVIIGFTSFVSLSLFQVLVDHTAFRRDTFILLYSIFFNFASSFSSFSLSFVISLACESAHMFLLPRSRFIHLYVIPLLPVTAFYTILLIDQWMLFYKIMFKCSQPARHDINTKVIQYCFIKTNNVSWNWIDNGTFIGRKWPFFYHPFHSFSSFIETSNSMNIKCVYWY